MMAEAWSIVKSTTLRRVWSKLKGMSSKKEVQREEVERKGREKQEKRQKRTKGQSRT